ncbi:DUF4349 domain-containing protein [Arcticibacterium luteifluviistationis]|uniref:DUF4349 domain-containing protein n=1 Tax=Arcticibacterium luteifluviistationis TaxID=1784714 RepID=A0A2Z4GI07_9BACT|nr:DUF4349 domain-containing protein [Arcticibacterium luteifluviistationis]AWW00708.1 DUF4349 domain-containing protein [Arcticibacterium luteifluviistationis]
MNKLLVLLFVTILFSCQSNQEELTSASEIDLSDFAEEEEVSSDNSESTIERKLIKNGKLEFETQDLSKTSKGIKENLKRLKGYISKESDYNNDYRQSKSMTLRIPAKSFDSFIESLDDYIEDFDSKIIEIRDVTADFIDNQARLKNKRLTEEKYLSLLSKASSVQDILAIEKELGAIRGDIESVEGLLKLMENKISYSSLDLSFYKVNKEESTFIYKIKKSLSGGWDNLLSFIVYVFNLWPFALLGIAIFWGIRKFRKKS